jgi:hypothetical protein
LCAVHTVFVLMAMFLNENGALGTVSEAMKVR